MKSNLIKGATLTVFATLLTLVVLQQGKFFDKEQPIEQRSKVQPDVPSMKSATPINTNEKPANRTLEEIVEEQDAEKAVSFRNYVAKTSVDSTLPKASDTNFEFEIPQFIQKPSKANTYRMMTSKSASYNFPFDLKDLVTQPALVRGFVPPLLVPIDTIRDRDTTMK
ncbi:MAG: hypothetical protein ACJASQ_003669 [Crocinitomicaceae bacterium]|jgi:hypothetical protein